VLTTLASIGPLTQSQLVAELGSDKSTMLHTLDDLERLELVERHPVRTARSKRSAPDQRSVRQPGHCGEPRVRDDRREGRNGLITGADRKTPTDAETASR
jgi:hypothetical protein